jgi:transcriptional regulator of met regulon
MCYTLCHCCRPTRKSKRGRRRLRWMSPTINDDILCRLFKDAMTNQRRHSTPPPHGRYDQLQKTTPSLPLRKCSAYYAQYDPIKHEIKLNWDLLPLKSYSYKRRPNTYIYIRLTKKSKRGRRRLWWMSPTINDDILCRLFKDATTNQRRHSTPPLHGRYDQLQKQPHLSPSGSVRPITHNMIQLNIKLSWTEIYYHQNHIRTKEGRTHTYT